MYHLQITTFVSENFLTLMTAGLLLTDFFQSENTFFHPRLV